MHTDNIVLVAGNLADHGLFPFFCVGLFPFILTVDGLMFFFSHDYDSDCSVLKNFTPTCNLFLLSNSIRYQYNSNTALVPIVAAVQSLLSPLQPLG